MANISESINFEKKISNPRAILALTPAAVVNVDFTDPKTYTLAINQNTTINVVGDYKNGDLVNIRITTTGLNTYSVTFAQSGVIFRGHFLSSGSLTNYADSKINAVSVFCHDSAAKEFEVMNTPLNS